MRLEAGFRQVVALCTRKENTTFAEFDLLSGAMGDHLPNLLTLARIALVPGFVASFWMDMPAGRWVAFVVFVIAAITDYADGWIARSRNLESRLGQMLDPICLLYTSPSPRDRTRSRMPSSA